MTRKTVTQIWPMDFRQFLRLGVNRIGWNKLRQNGTNWKEFLTIEREQADRDLTCAFECRTVPLSFVSYVSHGKAASDGGG